MTFLFLLFALFFPSCASEDSVMCYWDDSTQGNGIGHSFIAITDTFIIYSEKD